MHRFFTIFHRFHCFSPFSSFFIVFHCFHRFSLFFIVLHCFSSLFSANRHFFVDFHHFYCFSSLFLFTIYYCVSSLFHRFSTLLQSNPANHETHLDFHFFLNWETFVKVWGEKTFCFIHFQYSIISHVYRPNLKELLWHRGNLFSPLKNFPKNAVIAESILTQFDRSKSGKLMAARSNRNSVVQVTWVWWNHKGCIVHSVNSHICIICWFWLCNKLNQNRFQSQNVRSEMENIFTARKIVFWLLSAGDHIVEISRIVII